MTLPRILLIRVELWAIRRLMALAKIVEPPTRSGVSSRLRRSAALRLVAISRRMLDAIAAETGWAGAPAKPFAGHRTDFVRS